MCSIFGTNIKDFNRLQQLAVEGQVRGKDATGVLVMHQEKKQFELYKDDVKASEFDFNKLSEGGFYLGHTRKTTQGNEKFNYNNHPFVDKDNELALAHNGVISNDDELRIGEIKIETDSYVVLQQLKKEKTDGEPLKIEDVKRVVEKMTGSFTLTILDIPNENLFLLRHNNPCYIRFNQDKGELVYASEPQMIRNPYGSESEIGTFIGNIEEDLIYQFDLNKSEFVNQKKFSAKIKRTTSSSYKKHYGYKGSGNTFYPQGYNEDTDSFEFDELKGRHIKKILKPMNYKNNYEKCDFCGRFYLTTNYVKAGKEEAGKCFCAYCWDEEEEGADEEHNIPIDKIKDFKNKNRIDIDESVIYSLAPSYYVQLPEDEKLNYLFCVGCQMYYHEDYYDIQYYKELDDKTVNGCLCEYCKDKEYIEGKVEVIEE